MFRIFFATVLTACSINAQSSPPQLDFEVASVRPAAQPAGGAFRAGTFGGPSNGDPSRITYNYATLARLITLAYRIDSSQLSGPDWINTMRFDITAKLPPGTTKEQVPIMLQNLLADRLKLRVHHQSRAMTVYELMTVSGGLKLKTASDKITSQDGVSGQPSVARDGFPEIPPGRNGLMQIDGRARWQYYNGKMEDLAKMLTRELHAPVTDATGLDKRYDMALFWVSEGVSAGPDNTADSVSGPMIFTALREQLGLRLVSKKGFGDVLVVEAAEKIPTEN